MSLLQQKLSDKALRTPPSTYYNIVCLDVKRYHNLKLFSIPIFLPLTQLRFVLRVGR